MSINPSRVRIGGPLASFAPGFAEELNRQGYTPLSATNQMKLFAHLSGWLVSEGLGTNELSTAEIDRFARVRSASGGGRLRSIKALRPLLVYLRSLGVVPPPFFLPEGPVEEVLDRYRNYLTIERGLGIPTARGYVDAMRHFLHARLSSDGLALDLAHLTAADIVAFVVGRCPGQRRGAARQTVSALRSLLGFLHMEGTIERSLAAFVPSVPSRRLAGLPKGLDADQVRRLLASCDRDTANGRRDFAVLTMLVRLGLRAGEVAKLELDDMDWRSADIVVRGKGNRIERLPLPGDVGDAMAAYLRCGRPTTARGRTLFVRIKAPHGAMTTSGVTQIVAAAARRAGLGQIHAHRLRHTAATQMLRAGAPLTEIGQVLRHRRALTTAIYAKVDDEVLRTIARSWPEVVA